MPLWTSGGFQAVFEIPYFLDALSDLMFVHAMLHLEFPSKKNDTISMQFLIY